MQDNAQEAGFADRTWRELGGAFGWPGWRVSSGRAQSGWEWNGSQSGQARDLNCGFTMASAGEDAGLIRRAERVIRPAKAKTRRLRVLVVTIC